MVNVGIGRYGPYVLHDKTYGNFDRKTHTYQYQGQDYDVLTVDLETAVDMLKHSRKKSAPTPIRELGPHPDDGETVAIFEGRYGPYVKHGKIPASIPKGRDIQDVRLEEALIWIADKAAKKSAGRRGTPKTSTRTKKATRKGVKKKAAKKKTTARKKLRKKSPPSNQSPPDATRGL